MVNTATRTWTDTNGNYVADCNLQNFDANGECAAISNRNFGSAVPAATFDDLSAAWLQPSREQLGVLGGCAARDFPARLVDVGYFRRIWQNFRVTDNLNVTARRLRRVQHGRAGQIHGCPTAAATRSRACVALKPSAFGRPTNNFNTLDHEVRQPDRALERLSTSTWTRGSRTA